MGWGSENPVEPVFNQSKKSGNLRQRDLNNGYSQNVDDSLNSNTISAKNQKKFEDEYKQTRDFKKQQQESAEEAKVISQLNKEQQRKRYDNNNGYHAQLNDLNAYN